MAFDPITAGEQLIGTVLDHVLPDKQANDAAKAQLAQMAAQGQLQQIMGQLQINLAEAQAASAAKNGLVQLFIAGWRPGIGWLCGLGLLWQYFLAPCLGWGWPSHPVPHIDGASLNDLLMALLGLGAMRTVDKINGVGGGH